ncbi:hypothetical protein GDO78_020511 [Eleutherodactylus coqui]|uniref:Secreted protein n=1 Tax=Eleutherodactylus coqui TaxID=57060 RepID=A0A8J6JXZ5_ELECQ|nr:hypothetical protein GDO78_020511 [Eleutherodactylus coqui]
MRVCSAVKRVLGCLLFLEGSQPVPSGDGVSRVGVSSAGVLAGDGAGVARPGVLSSSLDGEGVLDSVCSGARSLFIMVVTRTAF